MKSKLNKIISIILTALMAVFLSLKPAYAHPGRTASDGCHYCRTNCDKWGYTYGTRHCHGGYTAPAPEPEVKTSLKPSPSPRPSFSPSLTPSVLPSIPSTKPQSENKPTSNPEVKGYETKAKSQPLSTTDWAIVLFLLAFVTSVFGLFGLGSYKLLLRIRKIFRRKNDF